MSALARFRPATRAWFADALGEPTPVQSLGWDAIARGDHALLLAPTGSGKTLAAFLWCLDQLHGLPADAPPGVRILYVSPLKALVYDVERNLRAPLAGIAERALREGLPARPIRVDIRTGDTSSAARRRQADDPADILVTTPESLFLRLGSASRDTLKTVHTVIVDEIHAFAGSKRGVHMALSLERLSERCAVEPQRIGLSATQRPLEEIAAFLGGDRPVAIVDAHAPPRMDLSVVVPMDDMALPTVASEGKGGDRLLPSAWNAIHPVLLAEIRAHRSTIVFVNSRLLCERIAGAINALAGEDLARAHHGSIARERRVETEELLKSGALRAIVATSSLELGIDMGAVDLVLQIESPGSVARGMQRIGRAGHHVGGTSIGKIFPKHRGDLLEAAVVAERMQAGAIEETRVPRNCLDVLAQQIVAIADERERSVDDVHALVRRTLPYRDLPREALTAVLDMLSGLYPSEEFGELRPRIAWDRVRDVIRSRRGANMVALVNAGTIPDRGLYGVFLGPKGPRIGELDEEMVYESRKGHVILLGASSWRIEEIARDRVIVSPAPGEPGRMPFWHGDSPGRPVDLGRAIGAFTREISEQPREDALAVLQSRHALDARAAGNLLAYLTEEREIAGALPTDRTLVVERFRDEVGDWRVCILSPYGSRLHAPWILALEAAIGRSRGFAVQALYADDGLALRFPDGEVPPPLADLLPDPDEIEDLVVAALADSAVFAGRFRENAGRALLLPRRTPGKRQPLWAQRLRSQNLLAIARKFPQFPIVLETYREILREVFDVPALIALLRAVRAGDVRIHEVETRGPSPFARTLAFQWAANFLYDTDAPLAERRAIAMTLDRDLLRGILGEAALRDLLTIDAIDQVVSELQRTADGWRATDADGLHDLLRRLGDLSREEIAVRCDGDATRWLETLRAEGRAIPVVIALQMRWIAAEDAVRYRDGLGITVPGAAVAIEGSAVPDPLGDLVLRYARTHGPFAATEPAGRWGLPAAAIHPLLDRLLERGTVERGAIRPGGKGVDWCDASVLKRLRRASLERGRSQIEAVHAPVLARFLVAHHAIGKAGTLREAIARLEGAALPWSDLVHAILPARVRDFSPSMLDELGAMGEIVWLGRGTLGARDGRVALYRRDRVPMLVEAPAPYAGSPLHAAIVAHLERRGACFLVELSNLANAPLDEVVAALWDLVWAGQLTNDTFTPLKELEKPRRKGRAEASRIAGGRWSLVQDLVGHAPADGTRRLHARATALIDRYGFVSREVTAAEDVAFSEVQPVLRAMEDQGHVRRGHFIEGLAAPYAAIGAVDRLRACADAAAETVLLATTDPANPYGGLLPWPVTRGRPRRAAGGRIALYAGAPVWIVDGTSLVTFEAMADDLALDGAIAALRAELARARKRSMRIDRIDGTEAGGGDVVDRLVAHGMMRDYKGLVLSRG